MYLPFIKGLIKIHGRYIFYIERKWEKGKMKLNLTKL